LSTAPVVPGVSTVVQRPIRVVAVACGRPIGRRSFCFYPYDLLSLFMKEDIFYRCSTELGRYAPIGKTI